MHRQIVASSGKGLSIPGFDYFLLNSARVKSDASWKIVSAVQRERERGHTLKSNKVATRTSQALIIGNKCNHFYVVDEQTHLGYSHCLVCSDQTTSGVAVKTFFEIFGVVISHTKLRGATGGTTIFRILTFRTAV